MEWRCEWCGKPHEEDDPPCDNCGHGSFEKAVVPAGGGTGSLGSEATAWVCTACGREHAKHTPPCTRCGHDELELRRQEVDEAELEVPGYLDLVTPRYVAALVGVLLLAGVFALGVTGVVDVPGFGASVPEVSEVPGDPDTAAGVALADAERGYLDRLNERREADGAARLTRDEDLDELATYLNQQRVKAEYGEAEDLPQDRLERLFRDRCEVSPAVFPGAVEAAAADSPDALAGAVLEAYDRQGVATGEAARTGVDLHAAPDGAVYVYQIAC